MITFFTERKKDIIYKYTDLQLEAATFNRSVSWKIKKINRIKKYG